MFQLNGKLADYFTHFEYADVTSWEWIRWREKSVVQVWHTKYRVYRRKETSMREVLAMQRALNTVRLLRKGLLGCQTAAGQHWYWFLCMEMLAFGSDAVFGMEVRCFG